MFVLSFILYLIPLWGLVTKGFANVSNYWYFGMIFFAAYVVANASEDILSLEIRANKIFYVTYALLTLVYFVFRYIYRNNIQYKYSSLWIVLMLVFAFILPYIKNSGLKSMCLIAFLVVNVAVNTNFSVKNRLPSYMDKGISLAEYYADFPDNAALEILDDSFYRVDKDNYMGEYNLNLPQWYGYNGMSVFHSVIQKQPYRYYTQTENRGLIVNNKISDLDSRAMAELLADTKYFLSPADNDSLVPYGYELYKESAGEKGNINIYRNKYNPALGYTYPSDIYVSEEEASKLSGIEKQELMMQAPIIDSESTGAGIADSYDFTSQELSYQIKELTDVTIDGDSISVKTNSGFITMEINHPADSEVYIRLGGLTPGEGNYFFKVICNGAVKEVYQYNKGEFHKVNRDEVLINLGYQEEAGQIECTVGFSKGMYSLDNLQVFGQSMRNMDAYAGRLLNETFTVEEMNSRRIEGTIDASCDKWLCFSLPYSGGWDLTVDEEKASVQCLNYMYLGTLIEKGQHHILLEYHIPGFRYGVMCSIVGTGLMICMGWRERNAKRKDQQLL